MKKTKRILSALLGAALCAGTVLATAYAVSSENTRESEQEAAAADFSLAPVEQLAAEKANEATLESSVQKIYFNSDSVEEAIGKLDDLGIVTYQTTKPKSADELDKEFVAESSECPTGSTTLPYSVTMGEIPAGSYVVTDNYFSIQKNTLNVRYKFWSTGSSDSVAIRATLLKRDKYSQEGTAWAYEDSITVESGRYVSSTFTFVDLDTEQYDYCVQFANYGVGSDNYVTGTAYIY